MKPKPSKPTFRVLRASDRLLRLAQESASLVLHPRSPMGGIRVVIMTIVPAMVTVIPKEQKVQRNLFLLCVAILS